MQSNDTKEPLGDLPSQGPPPTQPVPKGPPASEQPASGPPASGPPPSGPPASRPPASGHPGHGAHTAQRPAKPKHPGKPPRPGHPEPSVQTAPSQKPTAPLLPKAPEPGALSQSEKEAIRNRAAGRAKVPSKFRDSIKHFFFSPTGVLKILRLGLLIGSAACFLTAEAHESYIVITVLETCIVLFFILIYMLTLHHLTNFIHWSLLDLINSFITTMFLLIVAVLAMQEKERRHLFYVGGSLCLSAVIVCLIDAIVVTKKMRNLMKSALTFGGETSSSPGPAKPAPEPPVALTPTPSPAPARAPSPTPSRAPLQAPSAAPGTASPPHTSHH